MSPVFNLVALLPMKAHSSRVPNKNFKFFHGKPLFMWILDTLLSVDAIDLVVINTDAKERLASHGVETSARVLVRDRRKDICGDDVSMNLIISDDIQNIRAKTYLMTHTTNPLLRVGTIEQALQRFSEAKSAFVADSLFTVNKIQTRFYRADASPVNHDPRYLIPTQELEPWYAENSNLYIFSRESFAATNARIGRRPIMFESPVLESIDIDTPEDWDFAVLAANYLAQRAVAII